MKDQEGFYVQLDHKEKILMNKNKSYILSGDHLQTLTTDEYFEILPNKEE